jgi:23S rRNA (guanosine2251-2'-O)-methyltransferase
MKIKQLQGKQATKYFKKLPTRNHEIILILENIQYAKNVANMYRTAESAGVSKIYLTGISHKPPFGIGLQKVSRGAENVINHEYVEKTEDLLPTIKEEGYHVIAIEIANKNVLLSDLKNYLGDKKKICFIAGNEDAGINHTTLEHCDAAVTIPMYGENPSLNVSTSVGAVLFGF